LKAAQSRGVLANFYLGLEFNPRTLNGTFDYKMYGGTEQFF
jgi:hypothetical protein